MTDTTTPAQRERMAALEAEGAGRLFACRFAGERVVRQFARYLERADPNQIGPALYDHLMMREGFIAHFDLQGFRHAYREPVVLLDELAHAFRPRWVSRVHADGMSDVEVSTRIHALARQHQERVLAEARVRLRERELAEAQRLAARHGYQLERADGAVRQAQPAREDTGGGEALALDLGGT